MRREKKLFATVNMIPYIDVMLVLLVIFMAATPLFNMGILVDLPKAVAKKIQLEGKPVVLTVTLDKKQYLQKGDGAQSPLLETDKEVEAWFAENKVSADTVVYVQADRNLIWQHVLDAMVRLNKLGWSKLTLVTQKEDS